MSELDKVTKQNSMIAHETSLNTQSLNDQAKGLKDISISLTDLITGQKNSTVKKIKPLKSKKADKNNYIPEEGDAKVIDFSSKQAERSEQAPPVSLEPRTAAASNITVPAAAEGEWEDI